MPKPKFELQPVPPPTYYPFHYPGQCISQDDNDTNMGGSSSKAPLSPTRQPISANRTTTVSLTSPPELPGCSSTGRVLEEASQPSSSFWSSSSASITVGGKTRGPIAKPDARSSISSWPSSVDGNLISATPLHCRRPLHTPVCLPADSPGASQAARLPVGSPSPLRPIKFSLSLIHI